MRCVALIHHGPNWIHGRDVYGQGPPIEAHLRSMCRRYDEGSLLIGGPFTSTRGGIAVLDVASEVDARRLMDADPAVSLGVMTYDLHTVRAYFDVYAGERTTAPASTLRPSEREARQP